MFFTYRNESDNREAILIEDIQRALEEKVQNDSNVSQHHRDFLFLGKNCMISAGGKLCNANSTLAGNDLHSSSLIYMISEESYHEVFEAFENERKTMVNCEFLAALSLCRILEISKLSFASIETNLQNEATKMNAGVGDDRFPHLYNKSALRVLVAKLAVELANKMMPAAYNAFNFDAFSQRGFQALVDEKFCCMHHEDAIEELDEKAKQWEGVERSIGVASSKPINSQAGTVFCTSMFKFLQLFWNVSEGLIDLGSGSGMIALYAATWASTLSNFSGSDSQEVQIEGVEIDLHRHLKSKLLLQCGSYIAKMAGLKWPKVKLSCADLGESTSWTTKAGLGFFNNYCYPAASENQAMKAIYTNARKFLGPDKIVRLACFDYEKLQFEKHQCITCVGILTEFGQWDGFRNCLYVLENCESFFRPIEQNCQAVISRWMGEFQDQSVQLQKNTMFLKGLLDNALKFQPASSADMKTFLRHIKAKIGFSDNIIDLMKKNVFQDTIQHDPQYLKMPMIYRPFLLTSVSAMIYLSLMKDFLHSYSTTCRAEITEFLEFLEEWLLKISHKTLPFSLSISSPRFSHKPTALLDVTSEMARSGQIQVGKKRKFANVWEKPP